MILPALARRIAADDYANRCRSHLTDTARCYRDLGHDGDHMHIDDRFHRIEWS